MATILAESDHFNRLAILLKQKNQQAGEKIFNYFSRKIFRFFMVRTLDRDAAEDLTQDVFLKIVERINSFDEAKGNFSSWLWQIVRNTAKDYYHEKTHQSLPLSQLKSDPEEKTNWLSKIELQEVIDTVKRFDPEEQELFSLHYLSDVSYKDLSKITGKPEGTLRVLVHRLAQKIRKKYNGQ